MGDSTNEQGSIPLRDFIPVALAYGALAVDLKCACSEFRSLCRECLGGRICRLCLISDREGRLEATKSSAVRSSISRLVFAISRLICFHGPCRDHVTVTAEIIRLHELPPTKQSDNVDLIPVVVIHDVVVVHCWLWFWLWFWIRLLLRLLVLVLDLDLLLWVWDADVCSN